MTSEKYVQSFNRKKKPEEKRNLEDFKDRGREDLKWPAHINMLMKLPQSGGNFLNSCGTMAF